MFQNIPNELRAYPHWVVWKHEQVDTGRWTKVPYHPSGYKASSTDPTQWVTFDAAVAAYGDGRQGYDGIGFVLNDANPFVFTDLDDPWGTKPDGSPKFPDPDAIYKVQQTVYARFAGTYAEISPSGRGLHIISLGVTPKGRKPEGTGMEMYGHARFMTMTGNVVNRLPITDQQDAITWLYNELGSAEKQIAFTGSFNDLEDDQTVINRCLNAANGQLFRDLANGDWQQYYGSQSEADFALIDILAYFTESRFQIARIFRMSALGQRDKAARDNYVFGMVDKSFDLKPPPIDMSGIREALDREWQRIAGAGTSAGATTTQHVPQPPPATPSAVQEATPDSYTFIEDPDNPYRKPVPGLLGAIAYYLYQQAPRPVPEIALAGAIGLMAGICGRSFNVSGTGLNQYILLLARTGRGKEAINSGVAKLMNAVCSLEQGGGNCPGAREFVGPGDIASGQALVKHMGKTSKSFVSILGEVDLTLKNMTSRNANAGLIKLKQIMLRAYSASGKGESLGDTIYSDQDKNTGAIESPAFSIVGEGTPGRFYAMLDEDLVADGLLPRFTIIEYNGDRVPLNIERASVQPSPQLIRWLAQLCGYSLMLNQRGTPMDVPMAPDAQALLHQFDITVDGIMNKAANDVIDQLWNRAYLKAVKLAAVVAIGVNMTDPVITLELAEYAIAMVKRDTSRLVARFVSGDVGDGMTKQHQDMRKAFKAGVRLSDTRAQSLGMTWQMQQDRIIPKRFLVQQLGNIASFKNAKEGTGRAIAAVLRDLMDQGLIQQVGATQLATYGKDTGIYYVVREPTWLTGGVTVD